MSILAAAVIAVAAFALGAGMLRLVQLVWRATADDCPLCGAQPNPRATLACFGPEGCPAGCECASMRTQPVPYTGLCICGESFDLNDPALKSHHDECRRLHEREGKRLRGERP